MLPHSILVHGPSGPLRGIHLSTQMVTSLNYSPDPHGLPIFGVLSYENTGFTFKVSMVKCLNPRHSGLYLLPKCFRITSETSLRSGSSSVRGQRCYCVSCLKANDHISWQAHSGPIVTPLELGSTSNICLMTHSF